MTFDQYFSLHGLDAGCECGCSLYRHVKTYPYDYADLEISPENMTECYGADSDRKDCGCKGFKPTDFDVIVLLAQNEKN